MYIENSTRSAKDRLPTPTLVEDEATISKKFTSMLISDDPSYHWRENM